MMKVKKILAVISCLCMVGSMSVPAFASENSVETIDSQFERTMGIVYDQLEYQDALDLYPVYEDIIRAQFYPEPLQMPGNVMPLADDDEVYRYAEHGGAATYKVPREFGAAPLETGMLCLDRPKTIEYIYSMVVGNTYNANDIIADVLGVTSLGVGMTVFNVLGRLMQDSIFDSIEECGDCAMIITTKNYMDGSTTSVLYGWSSRYWMQPPTNAFDLNYTIFTS